MALLRGLVYTVLLALLVAFATYNWIPVSVTIAPGWQAHTLLPVLLFAVMLVGIAPLAVFSAVSRWHYRRKIKHLTAKLAAALADTETPPPPASSGNDAALSSPDLAFLPPLLPPTA